jgi:dCTP deaminase
MSSDETPPLADGVQDRGRRHGYWSNRTLVAELVKRGIVAEADYDKGRVDAASYQLRVGPEVYVTPTAADVDPKYRTKRALEKKQAVIIPPGQFAIICTEEKVRIPSDTMAFIGLRMKPKLRGLINVSGFHAEPGYEGRLLFSVFNAGPSEIHVARGDEWFMISFVDLDLPADPPRTVPGYDGIPTEFTSALSSEFLTLKGLDAKLDKNKSELMERLHLMEREHTIIRWAMVLLLGAVISYGVSYWARIASQPPSAQGSTISGDTSGQ